MDIRGLWDQVLKIFRYVPKEGAKCSACGEDGKFAQAPYPLPYSDCWCDTCCELEGIAYVVWRDMFPDEHKFNVPFPFLTSVEDIPPDCLTLNLEEVKTFYREKFFKCNS